MPTVIIDNIREISVEDYFDNKTNFPDIKYTLLSYIEPLPTYKAPLLEKCINYSIDIDADLEYIHRSTIAGIKQYLTEHGFIDTDYSITVDDTCMFHVNFNITSSYLLNGVIISYLNTNNFEWSVDTTDVIVFSN